MNTTTHENLVILFTYLVLVLCDVFMYGLRRLSRVEVISEILKIKNMKFFHLLFSCVVVFMYGIRNQWKQPSYPVESFKNTLKSCPRIKMKTSKQCENTY